MSATFCESWSVSGKWCSVSRKIWCQLSSCLIAYEGHEVRLLPVLRDLGDHVDGGETSTVISYAAPSHSNSQSEGCSLIEAVNVVNGPGEDFLGRLSIELLVDLLELLGRVLRGEDVAVDSHCAFSGSPRVSGRGE